MQICEGLTTPPSLNLTERDHASFTHPQTGHIVLTETDTKIHFLSWKWHYTETTPFLLTYRGSASFPETDTKAMSPLLTQWRPKIYSSFTETDRLSQASFTLVSVESVVKLAWLAPRFTDCCDITYKRNHVPFLFCSQHKHTLQGYEDWLRHKADNEVNGAPVFVVRSGGLVQTRSKNIRVSYTVNLLNLLPFL